MVDTRLEVHRVGGGDPGFGTVTRLSPEADRGEALLRRFDTDLAGHEGKPLLAGSDDGHVTA